MVPRLLCPHLARRAEVGSVATDPLKRTRPGRGQNDGDMVVLRAYERMADTLSNATRL
jgi:hypothetical protein